MIDPMTMDTFCGRYNEKNTESFAARTQASITHNSVHLVDEYGNHHSFSVAMLQHWLRDIADLRQTTLDTE